MKGGNVKVFCNHCNQIFWQGNLIGWAIELGKRKEPKWFKIASKHEALPDHNIDVEYPTQTVSFFNLLPTHEMRA